MKYVFDIDGTICSTDSSHSYENAKPFDDVVKKINELFYKGNDITLFTARGSSSGLNWHDLTVEQLNKWGVKYHRLIDQGKPSWDLFIDDKCINAEEWRKSIKTKKIGVVASAFDLLHCGHCLMLKEAKSLCDKLVAGLHTDPTLDRPQKNKPIQSLEERRILLESIKYIDEIFLYNTEAELDSTLSEIRPDIRIVGSDWIGKKLTGQQHCKSIYYHKRDHNWSTSELRKRVANAERSRV